MECVLVLGIETPQRLQAGRGIAQILRVGVECKQRCATEASFDFKIDSLGRSCMTIVWLAVFVNSGPSVAANGRRAGGGGLL
jgi:hypothetical protein